MKKRTQTTDDWTSLITPTSRSSPKSTPRAKSAKSIKVTDKDVVDFDLKFLELCISLEYDNNAAIRLLKIINVYLESNQPLPYNIRDYLCRALTKVIDAPANERALVLGKALGLTRSNQRPKKADTDEIGVLVEKHLPKAKNLTAARKEVSKLKGLGRRTVDRYHQAHIRANEAFADLKKREHAIKKK